MSAEKNTTSDRARTRTLKRIERLVGEPIIPGDKSISHRGLIFGALAEGTTEVQDILDSGDVRSTAGVLRALGVRIETEGKVTRVEGVGARGFRDPAAPLDCGNSGTTIRLMMGVLAGRGVTAELFGDVSLSRRPMKRVSEPLRRMGADFTLSNGDYPPLHVRGARLRAIDYDLPIASAQIKSAILLAALAAEGTTTVRGKIESRDHTERFLRHFGAEIETSAESIRLRGGQALKASRVTVPGDPSTAAFWMGGACLFPESKVVLRNIALNSSRTGFLRALERMGARIDVTETGTTPEPIGTITVHGLAHGKFRGTTVVESEVPTLIDEIPLLAVLATQAEGWTEVSGAEELRVKESDRIEAVATNLRKMGAEIEVMPDGFRIRGPQRLHGARLETFHDHRIAMAFSIAALVADGETTIVDADCAGISYPNFFADLESLSGSAGAK